VPAKILSIRPGKIALPGEMPLAGLESSEMALPQDAPSAPAGPVPSGVPAARPMRSGPPPGGPVPGGLAVPVTLPVPAARPVVPAVAVPAGHPGTPGPRRHLAAPSIRSAERRRCCADLLAPGTAGVVLHGAGGIGKSALAVEIAGRAGRLEPGRLTVAFTGAVSADTFLARLASALRRHPVAASRGGARALAAAGRTDLSWAHRLDLFRDHILGQVPVLLVLDDFDDNLTARAARPAIEDPALAGLLARLAGAPGLARLLITCREPFVLPGEAGQALVPRHVGPLSASGAARLAASLPALSLLDEPEIGLAWRLTAGHPRAMEYLDALLSGGRDGFIEVAERLAAAIEAGTGRAVLRLDPGATSPGHPAVAEQVAGVAGDLLLGELCARLSPDAHDLLTGASVYREPVGSHVLLLPAGQPRQAAGLTGLVAECAAAGLLTADYSGELPSVFVHRWTATELHRRLARERRGEEIADAHRRAAEYWRWRMSSWPHDRHALHEASHHLLQAGDQGRRGQLRARRTLRQRLLMLGAAVLVTAVTAGMTAAATGALSAPPGAPGGAAPAGAPPPAADPLAGRSAAVRGQAASWVARQVSRDAIVACDPAMCAALQADGIAPGNILVLRPSSGDPLGSDVVLATPAVRSQFGRRLASVYAPVVIASFGTGALRIDVRAMAPDGAGAYRAALAADLAARRGAGQQLLRNPRVSVSAAARSDLAGGRVDARLLLILAAVASVDPVRVAAFTDSGPGAAPGVPLRAVELTVPAQAHAGSAPGPGATPGNGSGTAPGAALRQVLAFARAQRPPYRPARAGIVRGPGGAPLLSVEFGAPSPAGLIEGQPLIRHGPG